MVYTVIFFFFLFQGDLLDAIKKDFGSFENFKERLNAATIAVQGSGWGWLVSYFPFSHMRLKYLIYT